VIWSGLVLGSLWCIAARFYGLKPLSSYYKYYSLVCDVYILYQFVVAMFVMFFALLLVRVACRKRYSAIRFMLSLPLCTFAAGATVMVAYGLCVFVVEVLFLGDYNYYYRIFLYEVESDLWSGLFIQTFISCVVVSAAMYLVMLPYAILVTTSSFYRERFFRGVNGDPALALRAL
jgi:hypothetical protein